MKDNTSVHYEIFYPVGCMESLRVYHSLASAKRAAADVLRIYGAVAIAYINAGVMETGYYKQNGKKWEIVKYD